MGATARKSVKAKDEDRVIRVGDIVGMPEIANRTGTSARAVWNHTRRYAFPAPVTRTSNTPLWDWNDVKEFYDAWEPSKGGYHTHKAQREAVAAKNNGRRPRRAVRVVKEGDPVNERSRVKA